MYLFNHPHDNCFNNILDLYYQYYDFLELRGVIFEAIDDNMKYGNIFDPVILESFQPKLKILRNEEMISLQGKPIEEIESKFEQINKMKLEVYQVLDKYKRNSVQNIQFVPNLMNYYILLDYCEYRLDLIKEEIRDYKEQDGKIDPFKSLTDSFSLSNDELEIIIYLYYTKFDNSRGFLGSLLLKKIFGMQSNIFSSQKYLIHEGALIKNNLLFVVLEEYDWLDSSFSISKTANLFISGIKKEIN